MRMIASIAERPDPAEASLIIAAILVAANTKVSTGHSGELDFAAPPIRESSVGLWQCRENRVHQRRSFIPAHPMATHPHDGTGETGLVEGRADRPPILRAVDAEHGRAAQLRHFV